jgi:hypothetical protein
MQRSRKIRGLSLISILFLVYYILGLEQQTDLFYGLGSLGFGCILLCFGYYFIKRSMQEENEAITILTPALALIFFGSIQNMYSGTPGPSWNSQMFLESIFAGLGMFSAYYATMKLYLVTDIATAEFPTLISSIVVQPLELIFLNSPLEIPYFLSSIAFVLIIGNMLILENRSKECSNE